MPHPARFVSARDAFAGSSHDRSDPVSPGEGGARLGADALAGRTEGLPR